MTYCPDCGEEPELIQVPESVFSHGYDQVGYTCLCCIVAVGIDEQDAREHWESMCEAKRDLNWNPYDA